MGWCTAARCDRRMVAPVLLLLLSRTHTHIYRRAMTETNSGAARPVSLSGLRKTAYTERRKERRMEWLREAEEGWAGGERLDRDGLYSWNACLKGGRQFVCGRLKQKDERVEKVKQRCDWGQNKQPMSRGVFLPIRRQTRLLVFTLFVFVDYGPLPVFVVVFVPLRSRVVKAAVFHVVRQ